MQRTFVLVLLATALVTSGSHAAARRPAHHPPTAAATPSGVTPEWVAGVLRDKGYKAVIGVDNDGDPKVTSAADGTKFTIFFYGCNGTRRCQSLTFQAGFDLDDGMSVTKVNAWNKDKRFLKAWLDEENDPFVEMDIDVEHGATSASLADYVDTWASILPNFKRYIGFD